jgi:tRNA pseudouridine-54 N-methylase
MRYLSGSIQAVSTWLMTSTHSQLSFQEQKEVLKLVKALRTNQSFFDSRTRAYDPGLEGSLSFMEGLVASAGQFRCEYVLRKTLKYRL